MIPFSQLADGRAGVYNSWHPPVMAFLLGLFDRLVPGTLLFLIFQSLLLLGALLALLWLKPRGWASAVLAAAIVAMPQWLLYQGEIWKDILFANAAIAGFAALARSMPRRGGRRRWPWRCCFWFWPRAPARTVWFCCRWRRSPRA